jgi:aminoglycoside 3-N-acetyltransferase
MIAAILSLPRRVARRVMAPIREARATAARHAARRAYPITQQQLQEALERLMGAPSEALMVHSSLSACGQFAEGPAGIISALRERCGTLCLPTHSYTYPVEIGERAPLFNPASTPSKNGALTEFFRAQPGVSRSIHATHSLAALGPLADLATRDHYTHDSPTGLGTPYSRLVHRPSAALMFGVHFHYYTFFHTAEFEAGSSHAFQQGVTDRLFVLDEAGEQRECLSRRQNWAPRRSRRYLVPQSWRRRPTSMPSAWALSRRLSRWAKPMPTRQP